MAVVAITKANIPLNGSVAFPTLTAITSTTDGALIDYDKSDNKIVVLVENAHATDAKTVTIKKGNALQGVSDLTVSLDAGDLKMFVVESGKFKNSSGTMKGKINVIGESTDIKVGAIVLP